jgi:hypothetical protein
VVVVEQNLLNNTFIHSDRLDQSTLPRSIYTHDGKCVHTLPQSYLDVAAAEEEEAGVHGRAVEVEEEAGMHKW